MRKAQTNHRLSPVAMGVLGIAFILLASTAIFRKDIPFKHGHRIDVMFRSSNQLIKGSPVRIAGIDAGKVIGLEPGPDLTTEVVRIEVKQSALPIHADATARIRPRLFLEGGFYIELRPGSPSARTLEDEGTIPVTQTSQPVQFNQILSELDIPVRQSLRTAVRELDVALEGGGVEGFGRVSKPLAPLLRNTAQIAQASRGSERRDLSTFISTAARMSKSIGEERRELTSLVSALSTTMGALSSNDEALRATVRELDGTLREAPDALAAFDRSLPALNRTSRDVLPALPLLPGVLDDGTKLLVQLRLASRPSELPLLLKRLRPSLQLLPTLVTRLTTLFGLVTPVTDCLRDKALPVLTTEVPDGALSTGYPTYLDLAHSLVGLAGAAGNFDANGPAVRYQASAGASAVSIGGVPSFDTLYGSTTEPILGSSPIWLGRGVETPKRPDQVCREQAAVDLRQRTPATMGTAAAQAENAGRARKVGG